MAHLNMHARIAIANWRAFHEAGLNKKRKIYGYAYSGNKPSLMGKFGVLDTGHYIILNLLRGLPASRGYNSEGEAYQVAVAKLKHTAEKNLLHSYISVFRMDSYQLKRLIEEGLK